MKTTAIPTSPCAKCGNPMDRATDPEQKNVPRVGDASICLRCGTLHVFRDDLSLRPATAEEEAQLPDSVALELARLRLVCRDTMRAAVSR